MADDPERLASVMADAIQTAASDVYPGDMVTRWVALVETIDSDGTRALITACQQDLKPWDALGMLQFAVQREQAAIVADHLEPD